MLDALTNALSHSDSVDICVGYFYFSGFQMLAEELKNKRVRIIVGREIDPSCVPDIVRYSRIKDESLDKWSPRRPTRSSIQLRQNYLDALVGFVNDSETFDDADTTSAFEMFISKILNGTLEIRKTNEDFHGKFYLIHNSKSYSQGGDFPGTLFMGSSNLTYRGLSGQGELNDSSREKQKFDEHQRKFDELWGSSNSISIAEKANAGDFVSEIERRLWIYQNPTPFEMYIRVLHEIYGNIEKENSILTPGKITAGQYLDFEYQTDAVKIAMNRIESFDGVIIADVVGLGKSVIASAVARNLDMNTVIIAPPHLISQWEDYKESFGIKGSRVFSSGNVKQIYERYADSKTPLLIVIDEAHRFRNEDTDDYKMLHQICRSNPSNKVMLLTATPFNNSPKDIFALMKLFQTPGQSTIPSIDNLSLRFRELIQRYRKLRLELKKISGAEIERQANEIAEEQRLFLEPVVIRRSRLDLEYITRYREDLKRQNISFPKIVGPELMEYDLGSLAELYIETLTKIGDPDSNEGFIGARYKPAMYLIETDKFLEKFGGAVDDVDLRVAQTNLSDFMRKLLVMRFESSKFAFRTTLERMIANNELIANWWHTLKLVPIMKKGRLPNPDEFSDEDGTFSDELENRLASLRRNNGLLEIPRAWIDEQFIVDVERDTVLLKGIHKNWFDEQEFADWDPKIDNLFFQVEKLLSLDPSRKIVVFSAYADTVNYLAENLASRGMSRILKFTASDATSENRKVLVGNFDASLPEKVQKDQFQVLICTDALSEGVNLHRAGVVINYDIPYNPTRVIQRIGRINRINKKVFDEILIFNCFPTVVGEKETRLRQISTLKIRLINNIVGTDTKSLTADEDVKTFFKDEFSRTEGSSEKLSWDSIYLEEYESVLNDLSLMTRVKQIPRRSRIARSGFHDERVLIFSKKGVNSLFVLAGKDEEPCVISSEEALAHFKANKEEASASVTNDFAPIFGRAKDKLFENHPLPEVRGRRQDALKNIEAVRHALPHQDGYCSDLIKVISKYDDISEGTLKDIAQIKEKSPEEAFNRIRALVPEAFIRNILNRIQRMEEDHDVILLAEELQL